MARIDELQKASRPERETAEALASATTALTQAVEDARGTLAEAAELAARRDGEGSAAARALTEGADALKAQGEALDKRLSTTDKQTAAAPEDMHEMKQAATVLESRLRTLGKDIVGGFSGAPG